MKKKIGFCKKEQGIFTQAYIRHIKDTLRAQVDCDVIDVDFREGYVLNDKAFVGDICLNDLDVYFWHDTVHPSQWHADNHFLHVLKAMESDVAVINTAESTRIVNDKFLSHMTLKKAGLPVGDFALVRADDRDALKSVFMQYEQDVLLKPRFGGWGIGIVRAQSVDVLLSTVEYMLSFAERKHHSLLVERFHKNDLSKWISVVVFGGKALFAYQKPLIGEADWKIYDPDRIDGRGRLSMCVAIPDEVRASAVAAQKAIGKDIIGFDFIYTEDGYKIVDENGRPGLYAHCLEEARIDVAQEIVNLVRSKL